MSFPSPSKQQARVLWFALTAVSFAVVLVVAGFFLWGIGRVIHKLSALLVPMALALILAYILNPVVEYFQRKGLSRLWSICLVFGIGSLFLLTLIGSVLPNLKNETSRLLKDLPSNVENVRTKAQHFAEQSTLAQQLPTSWRRAMVGNESPLPAAPLHPASTGLTNNAVETNNGASNLNSTGDAVTNQVPIAPAATELSNVVDDPFNMALVPAISRGLLWGLKWTIARLSKVTTWAEFLIGFVLVPVYLFYFLLEKEEITRRWTDYLPMKESAEKEELVFVLRSINDCMIVFFRGQVLVALCVGTLLATGYVIMGLNYAVLLGVVAAVLGIIPYLGTITSLLLALAVAGFQFGDWTHPLIVVGIAGVVKILEDFLISPKIIGERSGLHPLTIIIAVMVGTTLLGGFLGALLAIPLTATLRTLMFRYVWTPIVAKQEEGVAEE